MTREMIHRAAPDHNVTGRTLDGLAFLFEHPSRVVDPGRAPYLEAFARGTATKTLAERATFPLVYFHSLMPNMPGARSRWSGEVFGPVRFTPAADGLEFTTTLSRTRGADEMLELLGDGALGDVSIGCYPIKSAKRDDGVVWRDEIRIAELSLAPVGTGQHEGAKVLSMRAGIGTPRLDSLRRKRARLGAP